MSSTTKKQQKDADLIKELQAENARLRKEIKQWEDWAREDNERREEFDRTYRGCYV